MDLKEILTYLNKLSLINTIRAFGPVYFTINPDLECGFYYYCFGSFDPIVEFGNLESLSMWMKNNPLDFEPANAKEWYYDHYSNWYRNALINRKD